jgi:hypothetical protein
MRAGHIADFTPIGDAAGDGGGGQQREQRRVPCQERVCARHGRVGRDLHDPAARRAGGEHGGVNAGRRDIDQRRRGDAGHGLAIDLRGESARARRAVIAFENGRDRGGHVVGPDPREHLGIGRDLAFGERGDVKRRGVAHDRVAVLRMGEDRGLRDGRGDGVGPVRRGEAHGGDHLAVAAIPVRGDDLQPQRIADRGAVRQGPAGDGFRAGFGRAIGLAAEHGVGRIDVIGERHARGVEAGLVGERLTHALRHDQRLGIDRGRAGSVEALTCQRDEARGRRRLHRRRRCRGDAPAIRVDRGDDGVGQDAGGARRAKGHEPLTEIANVKRQHHYTVWKATRSPGAVTVN